MIASNDSKLEFVFLVNQFFFLFFFFFQKGKVFFYLYSEKKLIIKKLFQKTFFFAIWKSNKLSNKVKFFFLVNSEIVKK